MVSPAFRPIVRLTLLAGQERFHRCLQDVDLTADFFSD
jgi:hypothetical protein